MHVQRGRVIHVCAAKHFSLYKDPQITKGGLWERKGIEERKMEEVIRKKKSRM